MVGTDAFISIRVATRLIDSEVRVGVNEDDDNVSLSTFILDE